MKHGMIAGMNEDYSDNNPHLATLYPAHLETVRQRHDHALEKAGANHAVIFSGSPDPNQVIYTFSSLWGTRC